MGGRSAPVDLDTGQRTQSRLAVSDDPATMTSGGYWHDRQRQKLAPEALDLAFQDELLSRLLELTGVELPGSD